MSDFYLFLIILLTRSDYLVITLSGLVFHHDQRMSVSVTVDVRWSLIRLANGLFERRNIVNGMV